MKSYFVLNYSITDRDKFSKYGPAVRKVLEPYFKANTAKILVNDNSINKTAIEGNPSQTLVILEFESSEVFEEFYNSKEYQDIIHLRTDASSGWAVAVSEFSMKSSTT